MPVAIIGNIIGGDLTCEEFGEEYDLMIKDNHITGDLLINKIDGNASIIQCSIKNDEAIEMSAEVLLAYRTFLGGYGKDIVNDCKQGSIRNITVHISPDDSVPHALTRCVNFMKRYCV